MNITYRLIGLVYEFRQLNPSLINKFAILLKYLIWNSRANFFNWKNSIEPLFLLMLVAKYLYLKVEYLSIRSDSSVILKCFING
jgi:hypothetical protein